MVPQADQFQQQMVWRVEHDEDSTGLATMHLVQREANDQDMAKHAGKQYRQVNSYEI